MARPGPDAAGGSRPTPTWFQVCQELRGRLDAADIEGSAREARWLVEEASGLGAGGSLSGFHQPATVERLARLEAMATRRLAGEPVQYVVGHWPFRRLDLVVDRRVLIPRPETEVVGDHALEEIDRMAADGIGGPIRVVDLGTGSGALGLAIASERPRTEVWGVERSAAAAEVARANAAALGLAGGRVRILEGSWYRPLPATLRGGVHLVVSNPPYVGGDEPLPTAVAQWEPIDALRPHAGASGLEAIEEIVAGAAGWLVTSGALVVEIGETQAAAVASLADRAGLTAVEVRPDLAGRPRALVARKR